MPCPGRGSPAPMVARGDPCQALSIRTKFSLKAEPVPAVSAARRARSCSGRACASRPWAGRRGRDAALASQRRRTRRRPRGDTSAAISPSPTRARGRRRPARHRDQRPVLLGLEDLRVHRLRGGLGDEVQRVRLGGDHRLRVVEVVGEDEPARWCGEAVRPPRAPAAGRRARAARPPPSAPRNRGPCRRGASRPRRSTPRGDPAMPGPKPNRSASACRMERSLRASPSAGVTGCMSCIQWWP